MSKKHAISPLRSENYPEWYQQIITAADLAEPSVVRGCMVIKPWGYAIWENMTALLDEMFKATGHRNAYFPLFIPLKLLAREAEHVEGFAKECAVVTHSRLETNESGELVPVAPLEEPLIVRPTSETIIGESFAKWVQSYRDLPLLINQWANVVRWEMRTRMFLRTTEFLWQEGHTAHETIEEAIEETKCMLECYRRFAEDFAAMPVICGRKSDSERFPGAVDTYCIEAMMQDKKALQVGTSHFLGQNFSQASKIKFMGRDGSEEFAWTTSWGVSTRLIGGLIMIHSDDDGLVLPPKLAPLQAVILPVIHDETSRPKILEACDRLCKELTEKTFEGKPIKIEIDRRDMRGGDKLWTWIKKGVPIIIELGNKEIENLSLSYIRRDSLIKTSEKSPVFIQTLPTLLKSVQDSLFNRALEFRKKNTVEIDSKKNFYEFFDDENQGGGFAISYWDGSKETEAKIKKDLGVTIRCIPENTSNQGRCPFTGNPGEYRAIWAKSY
ncbi:MAG: proline--tRNA ligase [Puniceicoccales bacterium]|jgi:prolyl-tRNA synthetase|nr:proline--tRNA ligase [Puniceicoccales bacterium]